MGLCPLSYGEGSVRRNSHPELPDAFLFPLTHPLFSGVAAAFRLSGLAPQFQYAWLAQSGGWPKADPIASSTALRALRLASLLDRFTMHNSCHSLTG